MLKTWPDQDEAALYCVWTGATHVLDPLQTELIQHLREGRRSTRELLDAVEPLFEGAEPGRLVEYLEATLVQLQALALVHPSSP